MYKQSNYRKRQLIVRAIYHAYRARKLTNEQRKFLLEGTEHLL